MEVYGSVATQFFNGSAHGHIQMSSDCVPIHYPSEIKTDSARKNYKQKLLSSSPETLFADLLKTGEICNLIFFSDHPSAWHKAIINHYPSVKKEGICNGWKVKIREPHDPDNTVITVNIYKNGTVMEHFTKLEMEMVQLRETVLKWEQSETCHTELKQNTEHLTQRLTALTQQMRKLQKEKDSYQCELTALRLQLQDREQSTLEMRQQLREIQEKREMENNEIQTLKEQLRDIQEKREMENSEIQALKEQQRDLLLARKEPEQTHRAQTLPSTPECSNTGSQHPPLCAERPDPDSSQPSLHPLSGSPVSAQQHEPLSHSRPAPTSTEEPEIALLIDSNGKFIDTKKLFPQHKAVKFWCPTTDKALELLTESQLGRPSHIIIHTGTNDLRSQQDRVSDSLRAVVEKARKTFPNSKIILSTLLQRKDFHPKTINKINSSISRHCALLPNVHLAHHPDLDTDCLYDHVHLYKNLVHIFAKRLKDVTLSRSDQTSPRWSRASPKPANPTRLTSGNYIAANTSPRPEHLPELQRANRIHTDRDYPTTAPQLQQLKPVHSRARPSQAD
ncbi:hypothetical protein DPX16_23019 [Anabarilius grahami]|uniref:Uncharacterized protein n=1 Tax=Anabarilius grahami TaxID=495550 RepID=A0A3N0XHE9_ANAGA|nr:hypothetical protein DPX16_23019 [Anabarilius grahami]